MPRKTKPLRESLHIKGWRDGCQAYGLLKRRAEPPYGSDGEYAAAWRDAQKVCRRQSIRVTVTEDTNGR